MMKTLALPIDVVPFTSIREPYKGLNSATFFSSYLTVPYIKSTEHSKVIRWYQDLFDRGNLERDQDYPVAVMDISPSKRNPVELVVLGGMGPEATLYFIQLIERYIPTFNVRVLMLTSTPDRSQALQSQDSQKKEAILDIFESVNRYLTNMCPEAKVIIPCNTAHLFSEPLKSKLISLVTSLSSRVQKEKFQKICVLSTQGTKNQGVYNNLPCEVIYPNPTDMDLLMQIIYNEIKGKGCVTDLSRRLLLDIITHYYDEVDVFGLCCTELPLIFQDRQFQSMLEQTGQLGKLYLDPMVEALSITRELRSGFELPPGNSSKGF